MVKIKYVRIFSVDPHTHICASLSMYRSVLEKMTIPFLYAVFLDASKCLWRIIKKRFASFRCVYFFWSACMSVELSHFRKSVCLQVFPKKKTWTFSVLSLRKNNNEQRTTCHSNYLLSFFFFLWSMLKKVGLWTFVTKIVKVCITFLILYSGRECDQFSFLSSSSNANWQ